MQQTLRHDHIDRFGKLSLRHAGRMHHLAISAAHSGRRILALLDQTTATVSNRATGEVLSTTTKEAPADGQSSSRI